MNDYRTPLFDQVNFLSMHNLRIRTIGHEKTIITLWFMCSPYICSTSCICVVPTHISAQVVVDFLTSMCGPHIYASTITTQAHNLVLLFYLELLRDDILDIL